MKPEQIRYRVMNIKDLVGIEEKDDINPYDWIGKQYVL